MTSLSKLVAIGLLLAGAAGAATTRPMDLTNRQARWVVVQAVIASSDATRGHLSRPARAWYQLGATPGERVVIVPGSEVERVFFADRQAVEHSFSDFVWTIDAATGHVIRASFSGAVSEPIRIGPIRTTVEVSIAAFFSTRMRGGYRQPHRVAGRSVVGWCADARRPDCTTVATAAYDPESGWVRANGAICAKWRSFRTQAYSPLGQARFSELAGGDERPEGLQSTPLVLAAEPAPPAC